MELLGVSMTEWIGYIAMVLLLISFMMKRCAQAKNYQFIRLRIFVAYGFMLATSWPIIISNAAIFGVNFYYLFVKKN